MANATFVLKEPNSNDETLIYLLFRYNNQKLKYSTGQKIFPKFWSKEKQRAKESKLFPEYLEFNSLLNTIESKTQSIYRRLINDSIEPTLDKIRDSLNNELYKGETQSKKDFVKFVSDYIENSAKKHGTTKHYKQTLARLNEYKTSKGTQLTFDNVDLNFYESFLKFCTDADYSLNTIGSYIKDIKLFMGAGFDRKLTTNIEFKNRKFKKMEEDTDNIYLTNAELNKLIKRNLQKNLRLDKVRDLLLIGCYTGLRYSDLIELKESNLLDKGTKLKIKTQKTGEIVMIPLNTFVRDTLKKYNGNPPVLISNAKMNEYLKELGNLVKINSAVQLSSTKGGKLHNENFKKHQLISVHTARRTFATNAFLSGVPTISIMKITGHRTEKSFMKYIKISQEDNANKLSSHPFFK